MYLNQVLAQLNREEVDKKGFLWEWLTLFYFEKIKSGGIEYDKFVPQTKTEKNLKRHKLHLPWHTIAFEQKKFDFLFKDLNYILFKF